MRSSAVPEFGFVFVFIVVFVFVFVFVFPISGCYLLQGEELRSSAVPAQS